MTSQAREVVEVHRASFSRAASAGVKIAMGSDAGISSHGRNLRELEQQMAAGQSRVDALRSATSVAAELLGLDGEVGTIEPGKRADLVLVEGDPLDVATLPQRIRAVYRDGVQVSGVPVSADALTV